MKTKRYKVNEKLYASVGDFIRFTQEVLKGTQVITSVNYDLRNLTTEKSVQYLKLTVDSALAVNKNWISLRKSINTVILCLDWYINRCNMDLKKYREKLHGET